MTAIKDGCLRKEANEIRISGGPLIKRKRGSVGIKASIPSKAGGVMDVGFAIPGQQARSVMQSIFEKGHVTRGWPGAVIQNS